VYGQAGLNLCVKDKSMTNTTFENFGLPPKLLQALTRNKFTTPTPIQAQTIPLALKGQDVLGSAQTGTGKTGAFGIPVIAGLLENPETAALIMTPTRELAGQVIKALEPMIPTADIRTTLLIGGEAMSRQLHQLRHGPRLIVGTPGRINDHLERGSLKLANVRYVVLDETDRMLDMGFGIQIERILKHVSSDRQTLMFSATMPSNIAKLSGKYMKNPARVAVGSTSTPAANIKQEVITTSDHDKYGRLVEQLNARKGSIIIFVKTKHGTEKLSDKLNRDDHRSDAIHGDLQQRRRERVIQGFRDKKYRILVATDVAARGLDIPHIEHVINYDMPQAPEDYIHRIGRTARAGAEGEAVSFVTSADGGKWRAIQRLMKGEEPNPEPIRRSPPRGGSRDGGGYGGGAGRKPFWKKDGDRPHREKAGGERPFGGDRPHRDAAASDRPRGERTFTDKPRGDRPYGDRPHSDRPHSDRPRGERPYGDKPHRERAGGDRPYSDRPHRADAAGSDRPRAERSFSDKPRGDRPHSDRPHSDKPRGEKAWGDKSRPYQGEKPYRGDRPAGDRPRSDKPRGERPHGDKPAGGRSFSGKPQGSKSFAGKPHRGGASAPRGRG
jgi:superfamily II DNA/RNA helicase